MPKGSGCGKKMGKEPKKAILIVMEKPKKKSKGKK